MNDIAWLACFLSVVGVILNANRKRLCWPVWLASNFFWGLFAAQTNQRPLFILNLVYGVANIYGMWKWQSPLQSPVAEPPLGSSSPFVVAKSAAEQKLLDALNAGRCPDCGSVDSMLRGPRGGMCINIKCGKCNKEFNVALPFFAERIRH